MRNEAGWGFVQQIKGEIDQACVDDERDEADPDEPGRQRSISIAEFAKAQLKARKTSAKASRSSKPKPDFFGFIMRLQKIAASAGDNVKETKPEITVALAIVMANCL